MTNLRPLLAGVFLAAHVVACAESITPPPVTPEPAATYDFAADGRAMAATMAAAGKQAEADEAARLKFMSEAYAAGVAKAHAELVSRCDKGRRLRGARLWVEAAEELVFQKDIEPRTAEIRARCRIPTVKQLGNGSHGLEVQQQEQQTVCKGGPPRGLTLDDATFAIHRSEYGPPPNLPLPSGEDAGENRACRDLDLEVGLDTQITYGDRAGLERALARKHADER